MTRPGWTTRYRLMRTTLRDLILSAYRDVRPAPSTPGRRLFGQDAASRTRAVSTNCSNRTIRSARTTK